MSNDSLKPQDGHAYRFPRQSINKFMDMNSLKDYKVIQKLGQGTFGVVQKAKHRGTNDLVALKQLLNHSAKEGFPITAMREITILKSLNHKNVLKINDMIYESPKVDNPQDLIHSRGCFYTVSPYMSSDLVGLLENPNIHLSIPQIKCLMLQLLEGTNYIHQQRYLHRDIKAANILIDYNGILKIADFGLARHYHGKKPDLGKGPGGGERNYTALVVTRWYRPPELLLGERKYTTSVDMWGVGCVFGELFNHKPILAGSSDSQQAQIIFELIGPPTSDNWYNANLLPNKTDYTIGLRCKRTLETRFSRFMKQDGLNLLSGLLALDPFKRLNSLDAINHEYFKNEPLPLKPHELPRFEESHEIDKERYKKQKQNNETSGYNSGPSAPVPSINAKAQPKVDTYIPNRSNRTETYIPRPKNNYPRTETYIPQPKPKNDVKLPDKPRVTNKSPSPQKLKAASRNSGIFMNSSRNISKPLPKRPLSSRSDPLAKRKKLADDANDSDLTDFDEDFKDESENKLNDFIDWNRYKDSKEYKNLEAASRKHSALDY